MPLYNQSKQFPLNNSKPHYNPDQPGKVTHINLDLKIDFDNESVIGTSNITLQTLQEISSFTINAIEMKIFKVIVDEQPANYVYDGEKILVSLETETQIDQTLQISIDYKLDHPRLGLTFVKPTNEYPDKPTQLWTQGESEQSRYWYPCFDYPKQICTSEISVEVPNNFTTVSNGLLVNSISKGDTRIDHWLQDTPHPNYLMCLTVGEFVEIKDSYKDIEVNYYTRKDKVKELQLTAQNTPKMIDYYSQFFGVAYPWKKYAQTWVHDYIWGGMENTNSTFNTEKGLLDERAVQDFDFAEILIAHELVHQWFGDYIIIDHWSHLWVKEGAATFGEYLWTRQAKGEDEFNYYKYLEAEEYQTEDSKLYRRPIVTNVFRDTEDLYDRHSYSKGGLVYNMIRAQLGDKLFQKALQHFLTTYQHQNVDSYTFLRAVSEATGRNLQPLFDQYVFRGGHPDFKVKYSWDEKKKIAKLVVEQTQVSENKNDTLFKLNIPIDFIFSNQETKELTTTQATLEIDQKEQVFYFNFRQKPEFCCFDSQWDYLKTVEFEAPLGDLNAMLKQATNINHRILAAKTIAKKGNLEALQTLAESLAEEKFWGVKVEVAGLIGDIKLDQAENYLIKSLNEPNPKVRIAILKSLANFPSEVTFKVVSEVVAKGDSSYFVEKTALTTLGTLAYRLKDAYIQDTIKICQEVIATRSGWNEVVRNGAILSLSKLKNKEALELILELTKYGSPEPLKVAALMSLGEVVSELEKPSIEQVVQILDQFSGNRFIDIERALILSLQQIQSAKAIPILQKISEQSLYGRIRNLAENAIKRVRANLGPQKAIAKLDEKLNNLNQENQKLKSRVEELEAQLKDS